MIGIIDYGMGNLRSVQKALELLGYETLISDEYHELSKCESLILPGVGAFPDAMANLKKASLDNIVKEYAESGRPVLGICLGMQLLFDVGYEVSECEGLGLIHGSVLKLLEDVKVPHMGWNSLSVRGNCPLLKGVEEESYVYFVHSFYAAVKNDEDLNAWTQYGGRVPAVVSRGSVYGVQFHPEKSGSVGLKILKNFGELSK